MRQQLGAHLSPLNREGAIDLWWDQKIPAGAVIDQEVSEHLEAADIILLLVSAEFIASDYCYATEVARALERHEQRSAHVVPIILRDCDWQHAPFAKLKAVPRDGRPIKSWPDRDRAYRDVADHIRKLAEAVNLQGRTPAGGTREQPPPPTAEPSPPILGHPTFRPGAAFPIDHHSPKNLAATLSRLARLTDLVEGADFYGDDSGHAAAGGDIHYVFDENVFEMFVHAQRHADYVNLFHNGMWHNQRKWSAGWRDINAQSALLTGEYLFSGSLPGQSDEVVHISDWHRHELLQRSYDMMRHFRWGGAPNELVREYLYRMARLRAAMGAQSGPDHEEALQPQILNDVRVLREAGVTEPDLDAYLSARVSVEALATDEHLVPLLQLERILSKEFHRKLRAVTAIAEPNGGDRAAIAAESQLWRERLLREERLSGRSGPRRRESAAIINDARTLALVNWVAKRSETAGKRTVFVTGDALLYAAYRRWHLETCRHAPFLVRRVMHYAPVFTLANRDMVQTPPADALRHALDIGLYRLNLTRFSGDPEIPVLRREFAQMIEDAEKSRDGAAIKELETFYSLPDDWYHEIDWMLDQIGDLWRQIERIVLGLNPDLIGYRISLSLPDSFILPGRVSDVSQADIDAWLQAVLASLRQGNMTLWLPIARKFIETTQSPGIRKARLLHLLGFADDDKLTGADGPEKYGRVLSDEVLLECPATAFSLAALVALNSEQWPEAHRFASLCVEATREPDTCLSERGRDESLYLASFVLRSRLLHLKPQAPTERSDEGGVELWGCISGLLKSSEKADGSLVKARAALELGNLASCLLSGWAVQEPAEVESTTKTGLKPDLLFHFALRGYRACIAMEEVGNVEGEIAQERLRMDAEASAGIALLKVIETRMPSLVDKNNRPSGRKGSNVPSVAKLLTILEARPELALPVTAYCVHCADREDLQSDLQIAAEAERAYYGHGLGARFADWILAKRGATDLSRAPAPG